MDWTALVTQIPLVAAFIWYALEMQKRGQEQMQAFLETLEKQNQQYEVRNRALVEVIDKLALKISEMNAQTCADHASLLEATRLAADEPKTRSRAAK